MVEEWSVNHEVVGWHRETVDLADGAELERKLREESFDVLVNTAAMTSVDACQDHEGAAIAINAHAPGVMAAVCREKGRRMIQVSTDYVFDGRKRTPYTEEDAPNPISLYGASKRQGEQGVLAGDDQNLVIRVSWIFGPHRPSFLEQILERSLREERVEAISDKWSSPAYSVDLSRWMEPLLSQGAGILHLCNPGGCTWQEYAQAALNAAIERGWPVRTERVEPLLLKEMKMFKARRPVSTVMDVGRYEALTGTKLRRWNEAVAEYVSQLDLETLV